MFIQVIGYRQKIDDRSGKIYNNQEHFKHIEITSVESLFSKHQEILKLIPEEERYDLHYTNAFCDPSAKPRTFAYQEMIVMDIDDMSDEDLADKKDEYINVVTKFLNVDPKKTAVVMSGHGLHFIIKVPRFDKITEALKKRYTSICNELTVELFNNGLTGKADPIRLMNAATLRFPGSENRKDPSKPVMSYLIQGNVEVQELPILFTKSGRLVEYKEVEQDSVMPVSVDAKTVLSECGFIKWAGENQNNVTEPQWTALIGTLAYIPSVGKSLCHTYSKGHDDYSEANTDAKIKRAVDFGKPRTCDSIAQIYPGCVECVHRGQVKTPLAIKGEDFIRTKDTGFHFVNDKGVAVPDFEGLFKHFRQKYTYVVLESSGIIFVFNGKHWEELPIARVEEFANTHFKPQATNGKRAEFRGIVVTSNLVNEDFFSDDNKGYINFNNGILKVDTRDLLPHSPKFGFTYCLPYDYDPKATCPTFDQVMDNVTLNDKSLQDIILEFMGYAISGMRAHYGSKALILTGSGSNGKSTILDVIKMSMGAKTFSTVAIRDLADKNSRYALVGKLMNICEEVDKDELLKTGTASFKSIVTGAEMQVKKLYADTITMRIDTKLVLSCNELPISKENNNAIYRRMLIIPFRATFSKGSQDKTLLKRIQSEMSGVYNRIIEGYDRFIANDYEFSESVVADKAINEFKQDNSIFNRFFEESYVITNIDSDYIIVDELAVTYNSWADLNNEKFRPTKHQIIKEFKTAGLIKESSIKKFGNSTKRVYTGIRKLNATGF